MRQAYYEGLEFLLCDRKTSLVRAVLEALIPSLAQMYLVYRLPFQQFARLSCPEGYSYLRVITDKRIMLHESHHIEQFSTWWGPWLIPLAAGLFPLPFIFSGRWFIERGAFLKSEIALGHMNVDQAAEVLWENYGKPWPKPLMRAWFRKQRRKHEGVYHRNSNIFN